MPVPEGDRKPKQRVIPVTSLIHEGVLWEETTNNPRFQFTARGGIMSDSIEVGNVKYVPMLDDLFAQGVVILPTHVEPYGTRGELLTSIQQMIHKYCQVSEPFERLASYYVMFTWFFDRFESIPYLRLLGDWGSGKSRSLRVIGAMCYKPMFANAGASRSAIFHIIDQMRGTLVMDEADFKENDEHYEIVRMLNCGNNRMTKYLRAEVVKKKSGTEAYKTKAFDVFGPKVLASRKLFPDEALESRCLTERIETLTRTDVPIELPPEFETETEIIRNKLLTHRLDKWMDIRPVTERFMGIEPRINQIINPIIAIFHDDEVIKNDILLFARKLNLILLEQRGTRWEAWVAKAIYDIKTVRPDTRHISLKEIADSINESKKLGEDEALSPRRLAGTFKEMGMRKKQIRARIHVIISDRMIETFKARYGVDHMDEDGTITGEDDASEMAGEILRDGNKSIDSFENTNHKKDKEPPEPFDDADSDTETKAYFQDNDPRFKRKDAEGKESEPRKENGGR